MSDLTDATHTLSLGPGPEDLSPLEQDVLEEYERLADNMKKVIYPHQHFSSTFTHNLTQKLACFHA